MINHVLVTIRLKGYLRLPSFNLLEGLLDESVKMPTGDYGLFELLEDYGVRYLTYGIASGGRYDGYYRLFLVNVDGNTEFYSLGFNTYRDYDESERREETYNLLMRQPRQTNQSCLQSVLRDHQQHHL